MGGYGAPDPGGWPDICMIFGGKRGEGKYSKKRESNEMSQGYRDVTSGYERGGGKVKSRQHSAGEERRKDPI